MVVQPWCIRARLIGMYFDTNKCFLLPTAMPTIGGVVRVYDDNTSSALLIVGHTDTTGSPKVNDPLSVERAESVTAFLTGDVKAWLARYHASITWSKRWGTKEDHLMIASVPDYATRTQDEPPLLWYQRTRGLPQSGNADDATRRTLIGEYMFEPARRAGRPPAPALHGSVPITTHGSGEHFPIEDHVGRVAANEHADPHNRRVELYFFDQQLGVQPAPPGIDSQSGSPQYPEWVRRARETHDFELVRKEILDVRLHDESSEPWPYAYALVKMTSREIYLQADVDGWISIPYPAACPELIEIAWGAPGPVDTHPFQRDVYVSCPPDASPPSSAMRLHNVGYDRSMPLAIAAKCFQADYGVDDTPEPRGLVNGRLPQDTKLRLDAIYEASCDARYREPTT